MSGLAKILRVGQQLFGYCGGVFGRDWSVFGTTRVEAIGADWVVVRSEDGESAFYRGDPEDLLKYTEPSEEDPA